MEKQTAVEWLVEQLRQLAHNPNNHLGMGDVRVTQGHLDELEEQAKAMEKEQIIRAHYLAGCYDTPTSYNEAVNYYKQTFKSE